MDEREAITKALNNLEYEFVPLKKNPEAYVLRSKHIWKGRVNSAACFAFRKDGIFNFKYFKNRNTTVENYIVSFRGKNPQVYRRRNGNIRNVTALHYDFYNNFNLLTQKAGSIVDATPKLKSAVESFIGVRDLTEVLYPLSRAIPIKGVPPTLRKHLREESLDLCIKRIMGYNTKAMRRVFFELVNSELADPRFQILNAVRWIGKDRLLECYNRMQIAPYGWIPYKLDLFKAFKGHEKKLLDIAGSRNDYYILMDSVSMYNQIREEDKEFDLFRLSFRTFSELHDKLAESQRRMGRGMHYARNIRITKIEEDINYLYGSKWENLMANPIILGTPYYVALPANSNELLRWGEELSNCLYSYRRHVNKDRVILGIKDKDNKLIYALEIINKDIMQFLGKCNRAPDEEDRRIITNFLEDSKIISKKRYRSVSTDGQYVQVYTDAF